MMKWPATSNEMRAAGYEYDNDSNCRGCGQFIEWWISPKGTKMPISVLRSPHPLKSNEETRQPHFIDCSKAKDFRR